MLKFLQAELPGLWTDEQYSLEFRQDPCPYKDFQHALLHVGKAMNRLNEMVEAADHGAVSFPPADVEKYVADLVICALRLAIKNPTGEFDLERAVFGRIETKMGAKLARQT